MKLLLTPRLRLIPLSKGDLIRTSEHRPALREIAGAAVSPRLIDPPVERAIRLKLETMERAPTEEHPWLKWAFSDPRCLGVTAIGVGSGNEASERVLAKLGMRLVWRDENRSDWRVDADGFSNRAG